MKILKHNDRRLIVPLPKPRNKGLNDVLLGRPGGRMKSSRDWSREREKKDLRRLLED